MIKQSETTTTAKSAPPSTISDQFSISLSYYFKATGAHMRTPISMVNVCLLNEQETETDQFVAREMIEIIVIKKKKKKFVARVSQYNYTDQLFTFRAALKQVNSKNFEYSLPIVWLLKALAILSLLEADAATPRELPLAAEEVLGWTSKPLSSIAYDLFDIISVALHSLHLSFEEVFSEEIAVCIAIVSESSLSKKPDILHISLEGKSAVQLVFADVKLEPQLEVSRLPMNFDDIAASLPFKETLNSKNK
uniref:Uncharacterized protein n=1 Tax=Glossina palpalis gambiensis TaxID=67801 RepID=A0A1B0BGV1_9MUSC